MFLSNVILGGIFAVAFGGWVAAQTLPPSLRPLSRDDAALLQQEAARAALAEIRPTARPAYMVRYPVIVETEPARVRPVARTMALPRTRWDNRRGTAIWTRAALSALSDQGARLVTTVPRDIEAWCPAYAQNPPDLRRAFWVGMMSALAKHESTHNPQAVGGGGQWYGLLQIYPDTARRYGCHARTGTALTDPAANLACAARIMAVTVARDNAIAVHDGRWRGVAADWGPMTNRAKVAEMSNWTRAQTYCRPISTVRPQARPADLVPRFRAAKADAALPAPG